MWLNTGYRRFCVNLILWMCCR